VTSPRSHGQRGAVAASESRWAGAQDLEPLLSSNSLGPSFGGGVGRTSPLVFGAPLQLGLAALTLG